MDMRKFTPRAPSGWLSLLMREALLRSVPVPGARRLFHGPWENDLPIVP